MHCTQSIIEIRTELTKFLQPLPEKSNLKEQLKLMRKACQDFNDTVGYPKFSQLDLPIQKSILERALFKLREKFGSSVAEVAIAYGLDVDDGLAVILYFNNTGNT